MIDAMAVWSGYRRVRDICMTMTTDTAVILLLAREMNVAFNAAVIKLRLAAAGL